MRAKRKRSTRQTKEWPALAVCEGRVDIVIGDGDETNLPIDETTLSICDNKDGMHLLLETTRGYEVIRAGQIVSTLQAAQLAFGIANDFEVTVHCSSALCDGTYQSGSLSISHYKQVGDNGPNKLVLAIVENVDSYRRVISAFVSPEQGKTVARELFAAVGRNGRGFAFIHSRKSRLT